MDIHIDSAKPLPLYKQIAHAIIEKIAAGELQQGDTLPSIRQLAKTLQINVNTVQKSYHDLAHRGVIELPDKAKAIICRQKTQEEALQHFEEDVKLIIAEAYAAGVSRLMMEKTYKKILRKRSIN
ncbi:GntR family transcriptional regulator [Kurthia sibirica]|uniref:GntR family transcriptional regulator n=1 Tax=Kurthia sibirica TaxID=202750 RepID=A0A2U3ALG7_9BACL|nr:GntR family transcriptional regulator [Kurthia sibirica]PWI25376.1 GntR family transcriptional regulator [Kurthia sibirica]GEK34607.1 GntR family transcriptional regulator [Kurthia sibirica]